MRYEHTHIHTQTHDIEYDPMAHNKHTYPWVHQYQMLMYGTPISDAYLW